ncbi:MULTISPECIES: uroporphyrinogen-III synthase [Acinetobacter]|uniref:uroporphyrinogen-III synthase n=1 Tax=Acinetobacter TaxID=469 RepID=UPI000235DF49|nr:MULTISPECIES: uroporphyrinogen-III synthase [Acinetobacter]KXZ75132.1 Uroporphyrinogen-III synthase [Acinetobacter venetianus]GAB01006.1 uroporphyrinogen-III synthase [Acinetobacter sp. NBRC 100985]
MLFINTRPQDRASTLTEALVDAGYQVETLPLLELTAVPFSIELQQLYQQLEQTQVIVVVSPTAVEVGMRYLQQANIDLVQLTHIRWIAVGQATAQALAKFKIESLVPKVESSEGMLDLPILKQQDQLKQIAFWRGLGGRQFMMQQLQQQGVSVLNFVLYRRQCPELSVLKIPTILKNIESHQQVAVLISSEASWNNWQQLTSQNQVEAEWIYLTLGERLTQLLTHSQALLNQASNIIQLEKLSASEIIHRMRCWQGKV